MLLLALLLVAGVGVGAYWFGWERYTTTPGVLGLDEAAATAELEDAGLDAEAGDPAYSENVARGPGHRDRSRPGRQGARRRHRHAWSSRWARSATTCPTSPGTTEDQAQDALAATNLAFGKSKGRWSETVPEGQVIRTSPKAGTTLKPGASGRPGAQPGPQADRGARTGPASRSTPRTAALEKRGLAGRA